MEKEHLFSFFSLRCKMSFCYVFIHLAFIMSNSSMLKKPTKYVDLAHSAGGIGRCSTLNQPTLHVVLAYTTWSVLDFLTSKSEKSHAKMGLICCKIGSFCYVEIAIRHSSSTLVKRNLLTFRTEPIPLIFFDKIAQTAVWAILRDSREVFQNQIVSRIASLVTFCQIQKKLPQNIHSYTFLL